MNDTENSHLPSIPGIYEDKLESIDNATYAISAVMKVLSHFNTEMGSEGPDDLHSLNNGYVRGGLTKAVCVLSMEIAGDVDYLKNKVRVQS